jgi:DNA-binding NarL/FixJ family response regulator
MIKIFIADNQPIVRKGLTVTISGEPDMQVCFEAKNTDELFKNVPDIETDIIILDINLDKKNGLDTLKKLKALKPETPILIFTNIPEDQFARRCLRDGSAGYMNKDIELAELTAAIRRILKGQKYISPAFAEKLLYEAEIRHNTTAPHDCLSDREFQVLILLAGNKTITEISEMMSLSVKTISTYKSRIFTKLNFSSKEEVVEYASKYKFT